MLQTRVDSGLDGVVVADTVMSEVDGEAGRLIVRGQSIEDLVRSRGFESVAALLWEGFAEGSGDEAAVRAGLALASDDPAALARPGNEALAVALIIISNTFYSWGESLTAAFLPELARRGALGRVSGWGWAFGYFGGMLTLGLCLAYVLWAQARGIPAKDFVPVTLLVTAAMYGGASLVTFALLREHAQPAAARTAGAGGLRLRFHRRGPRPHDGRSLGQHQHLDRELVRDLCRALRQPHT